MCVFQHVLPVQSAPESDTLISRCMEAPTESERVKEADGRITAELFCSGRGVLKALPATKRGEKRGFSAVLPLPVPALPEGRGVTKNGLPPAVLFGGRGSTCERLCAFRSTDRFSTVVS